MKKEIVTLVLVVLVVIAIAQAVQINTQKVKVGEKFAPLTAAVVAEPSPDDGTDLAPEAVPESAE